MFQPSSSANHRNRRLLSFDRHSFFWAVYILYLEMRLTLNYWGNKPWVFASRYQWARLISVVYLTPRLTTPAALANFTCSVRQGEQQTWGGRGISASSKGTGQHETRNSWFLQRNSWISIRTTGWSTQEKRLKTVVSHTGKKFHTKGTT